MNIINLNEFEKLEKLRDNNHFKNFSVKKLLKLPSYNGVCELKFNNIKFYMLNIENDDTVPLKYFWKRSYESYTLEIWYKMTRLNGIFFDIGAHTGIYSIIGNLNKKDNNIISIEPFYLNYSRLLSNLKLNRIKTHSCFLNAVSNCVGETSFKINTCSHYHSQSGFISDDGDIKVKKIKIDDFNLKNRKIMGMKIDTEGHEFEILVGSLEILKMNKPDLIFEINTLSFEKCNELLSELGYNLYYIDDVNKKLKKILAFQETFIKNEGSNCFATIKSF